MKIMDAVLEEVSVGPASEAMALLTIDALVYHGPGKRAWRTTRSATPRRSSLKVLLQRA